MPPIPKSHHIVEQEETPLLLPFDDSSSYSDEESLLNLNHNNDDAGDYDSRKTKNQSCVNYSSLYRDDGYDDDDSESSLFMNDKQLLQEENDKKNPCILSFLCCCYYFFPWLWNCYYKALQEQPLLVKSITAFFLMGIADVLAQLVEELVLHRKTNEEENVTMHKNHNGDENDDDDFVFFFFFLDNMDWMRSFRFAIFGLVGAPWTHYYYDWLDTVLPPTPEPWTWTTAAKVIIDQFIQAPILLGLIIMAMSLMEGRGIGGMLSDMKRQYITTLIENWKLWIPATIINIAFVKPELRVLYDNLVFFGWTIILSMILNSPK